MPIKREMHEAVAGRASDHYLRTFRPITPALCAIAFIAAWQIDGNDDLLHVAYGMIGSTLLALVYLLATRVISTHAVLTISLFLDSLVIAWLVAQVAEPEAVSSAFLWSVALGGLFVTERMLIAVTAFAALLSVVVPLIGTRTVEPAVLIANVVIFFVVASAMIFARRQERLTSIALARSRRQLAEAQRVASVGSFIWYPRTKALEWSDEMYRIWGVEPGQVTPSHDYLEQIIPLDRATVKARVADAVANQTSYDEDLRLMQPDGSIRVVHAIGNWTDGLDGQPCLVGTAQDVTRMRDIEDQQLEFVATASHELRTPAAIVGGFAETLERQWGQLDDSRRLEMIAHIRIGADRLGGLIEDVLQVSRIESRNVSLKPEQFRIDELIAVAIAELREPRIEVRSTSDDTAWGDPRRLRQVLDNLLENALRHSREQVRIDMRTSECNQFMQVDIDDDGPGIDHVDRERIFERFARLSPATQHASKGTGLGLYIARQLVELGGGKLVVRDSELGGACFHFTVPMRDQPAAR